MERRAIYKSALKLIKEGKFGNVSLAEIGYHARVSGTAVEIIFENREQLVIELGRYTIGRINQIISETCDSFESFEDRYFDLWNNLRQYYYSQPDAISFQENFIHLPVRIEEVRSLSEKTTEMLIKFFAKGMGQNEDNGWNARTVANLFQENVKASVKCLSQEDTEKGKELAFLFWKGLHEAKKQEIDAIGNKSLAA